MTPNRFVPIGVALLLATMSSSVQAFFDPPWITPAAPREGQQVLLNVHGGTCDVFVERPGYPQVTQSGNDIRIVEYGNRETFDDFCNYGIWTIIEPIGIFPPGSYTLTVDFIYEDYPFGYTTSTLGVIPFIVTGATSAAPVPVVPHLWKFVLLVLLSSIAARALRTRQRDSLVASRGS